MAKSNLRDDDIAKLAEFILKECGTSLENYTLNGSREKILNAVRGVFDAGFNYGVNSTIHTIKKIGG
jgi:hypothetical protein